MRSRYFLPYCTHLVACVLACQQVHAQSGPTVYRSDITDVASRSIDLGRPVGAISGAAGVSGNGSGTYTIPIPLPPGTKDMAPSLSLNYDSRAGNGLMGMGWSFSAMSVIMRVGKDHFHDNATTPIQYGPDDRFALDGQRLVLTGGGTYGAAGSTYDTENASFAVITANGTFGSGPISFTMVTKDGLTMEYGTNGSHIRTSDNTDNVAWRLSRIRDVYGNTISYTYGELDGEPLLLSIAYTQNDAQALNAFCTVSFSYSYRADPNTIHVARRAMLQRHLLDGISITVTALENGSMTSHVYRRFDLKYSQRDLGNSFLSEVVEFGRDGSASLNSTAIQYGEQPAAIVEEAGMTFGFVSNEESNIHMGDYDGDGRSDLLRAYTSIDPSTGIRRVYKLKIYPANGGTEYEYVMTPGTYGVDMSNYGHDYYQGLVSSDMNGDGKDDICLVFTEYVPGMGFVYHHFLRKIRILLSDATDGLGFTVQDHDPPADSYYPSVIDPVNSIQFGDFDGDGKVELLAHCVNPNFYVSYKLYMLKDGTWTHLPVTGGDGNLKNPDRLMVVDVNGDRKTDLLVLNQPSNGWNAPSTASVYSWNGSAMALLSLSGIPSSSTEAHVGDHEDYDVYPGDFNGDGNTDLLVSAPLSQNEKWRIYFSNGSGYTYTYSVFTFSPAPSWPTDRRKVLVADMNGDGRSDIFHFHPAPPGQTDLSIYYSMGHTGGAPLFTARHSTLANNLGFLYACDQNGDGRHDILSFNSYVSPLRKVMIGPDGYERYAKKIANGLNAIDEFVYGRAVDVPFTGAVDRTYPIIRTKLPMHLVLAHRSPDGTGGTRQVDHSFSSPHLHMAGRGFLGFARTSSLDGVVRTEQDRTFNGTYALALPGPTTKTDVPGAVLLQTVQPTPTVATVSTGRFSVRMPTEVSTDHLAGTRITVGQGYDAYGNVTSRTVTQAVVSPASTVHTEVVSIQYAAYGPSSVPAKPTYITTQRTRAGSPMVSDVTRLEYNAQGAMFRRTDFNGQAKWVRTEHTFNGLGLVTGSTVSTAASGTTGGRSETYAYDHTGRFVTVKQFMFHNGASHWITTSAEYDLHRGKPKKVTGADGLNVSYGYDAFDRLSFESAPYEVNPNQNLNTLHSWAWDLAPPFRYYRNSVVSPSEPDVKTWFDILGRTTDVQTEAFGVGGNGPTSETRYDARGRIRRTTAPRMGAEPTMYEERSYDNYDRLTSVLNSVSGTTTIGYTYNLGRTTVTTTSPTGQVTARTTDAAGKLLSATDGGGTLNYAYDGWGNALTVKRGTTTIVTNTYDVYGRQTHLADAAAGTTQYTYDAFGRLTWQKDATGNETNLTYDNLGRLKTRNNVTWQYYHAGGKFSSVPVSVADPSTSLTYGYDAFFRRTSEVRTIGGETFTTQYAYNIYDKVTTMTFPSGVAITYTYNQNCYIDQVKRGATKLFDAVSFNGLGQPTSYILGDGKTTQTTYTHGLPTRYLASGVQDLQMSYDFATGNLLERADPLSNVKETFGYDALDRLTGSTRAAISPPLVAPTITYTYDGTVGGTTRGNIGRITGLGQLGSSAGNALVAAYGPNWPTPSNDPPVGISQQTQAITYTDRLLPATITETVGSDNWLLNYQYGADGARWKSELKKNGTTTETRTYAGAYEEQRLVSPALTNKVHYVDGPAGLCAMIVVASGVETIYYTYKDHLGSVVAFTKGSGATFSVVHKRSFDAWGRERHATAWTGAPVAAPFKWMYRGYTGHEHVEPFALVNMNARLYDPIAARMLSPDPLVASGTSTQAFNRYAYAFNNPLSYTDPDGRLPFLLAPITFLLGSMLESTLNNGFNSASLQAGWASYNRASAGLASVTSVRLGELQVGNWSMDLRVGLAFGSSIGVGLSGTITYTDGNFTASIGGSLYGFAHTYGPGGMRFEGTVGGSVGWNDGNGFFNIYSSAFYSKGTNQRVGGVAFGGRNWSFATENDFIPLLGDKNDRYRTASARLRVGEFDARLRLYTGDPQLHLPEDQRVDRESGGKGGLYIHERANDFRAGVLSIAYGGAEYGISSESIRHATQNVAIHDNFLRWAQLGASPWFSRLPGQFPPWGHYQLGPARPFTLW